MVLHQRAWQGSQAAQIQARLRELGLCAGPRLSTESDTRLPHCLAEWTGSGDDCLSMQVKPLKLRGTGRAVVEIRQLNLGRSRTRVGEL